MLSPITASQWDFGAAAHLLVRAGFGADPVEIENTAAFGPDKAVASLLSQLGNSLALISRLIAGGLPTRVYYASQGGYDTHAGQVNTHKRLLNELGTSLAAFCSDLKAKSVFDQVLVVTFSEFGRRVSENANGGTDHGTAAPMFVCGGSVAISAGANVVPDGWDDTVGKIAADAGQEIGSRLSRLMSRFRRGGNK